MKYLYLISLLTLAFGLSAQTSGCSEEKRAKAGTFDVSIDKNQCDRTNSLTIRPLSPKELCRIENERHSTETRTIILKGLKVQIHPESKIKESSYENE